MTDYPEPARDTGDATMLLPRYLDYFRATAARKLASLPEPALRTSTVPSGWTPMELVHHLVHMERRWFVWGFLAEPVEDPWGDHAVDPDRHPEHPDADRWAVPDDLTREALVERLHAGGRRTTEVLASHAPETVAATGGRFHADPPTLGWIGFHVLHEYARHLGHLDVAVETAGGDVGE